MKKRAGKTEKVSISLERRELGILRKRAKTLYDGNLSAVVSEAARLFERESARRELVQWLGDAAAMTPEQEAAIVAEILGLSVPKRRRTA